MTPRPDGRLLVVLAFAAGAMDAISFLGLDEVFTANMTGNTVLLGLALGQGSFDAVWRSATALGGFVVGAAAAAAVVETRSSAPPDAVPWPRRVTLTIVFECGLLGAFALAWALAGEQPTGGAVYGLIALASCAMGVQAGAVRRLHVPDVLTVVITGTLTSFVARLTTRATRPHGRRPDEDSGPPLDIRAAVVAGVALGAVAGGAVELHAHDAAGLVALAAACSVAAMTAWRRTQPA